VDFPNTKAIADLTTSVSGLHEEMRLGFSDVKGKIDNLDGRLVGVEGNLKGLDARLSVHESPCLTNRSRSVLERRQTKG
jgi:hypothetical protein